MFNLKALFGKKGSGKAKSGPAEGAAAGIDRRKTAQLNYDLAVHYLQEENDAVHARIYFLYAVKNIKDLAESEKDPEDLVLLGRSYILLGKSFMDEGDYRQAGMYWKNALATEKLQIASEPENKEYYTSAMIGSQFAGWCFLQCGQEKEAYDCYEQGLAVIREAEDKRFPGRLFIYGPDDKRELCSFRAEACIRMAGLSHDPRKTSALCTECLQALTNHYFQSLSADSLYDLAYGNYLCSRCVQGDEKKTYLEAAAEMCDIGLESGENKLKLTKLKRML